MLSPSMKEFVTHAANVIIKQQERTASQDMSIQSMKKFVTPAANVLIKEKQRTVLKNM